MARMARVVVPGTMEFRTIGRNYFDPGIRSTMTFGEQFYLTTSNPLRRLLRNLRLLSYIAFLFWTWLIVGGRVRRARQRAEKTGEKLYIDDLAGGDIMGKHEKD